MIQKGKKRKKKRFNKHKENICTGLERLLYINIEMIIKNNLILLKIILT